ncbi:MAG: DUF4097 family beta strand repeat-containing protein [Balneolaceae bacterium]|nr:DUF4097 family beta strand repeat-containing protein [Balneolaceae bacterium]
MNSSGLALRITVMLLFLGLTATSYAQRTDTYNLDETYIIDRNGTIELHTDDAGLVEINGSDRSDVRVIVTYRREVRGVRVGKLDKFAMDVTERNGNLIIRENYEDRGTINLNIGSVNRKYTVTILAPETVNLELYGDDDTYEISDMNGNIRMETDDSDISLRDCNGEEFNFEFDDGSLIMNNGHGRLTMSYDDGEADIRGSQFSNIDVEMEDGDFNLSTTLADNGRYAITADDGDIDLTILGGGGNFRIEHDDVRVSADSDFQQRGRNENFTEYRLPGGNARVDIETDDGDVRLFIR